MTRLAPRLVSLVLPALPAFLPATASARPGDWDAPVPVRAVPFVHASDTTPRVGRAARYDCAPGLSEAGPEVLYVFDAPAAGVLTAWVEGDADPVDLDIHLLEDTALDAAGTATGCLARSNTVAEARVAAGPVYIAVDSYEGAHRAGPYRLHVDFQAPDTWYRREVARGVWVETKAYTDLFGAVQTGSVLRIDPATPGLTIRPVVPAGGGCATTSSLARAAGAVAAVNAGFFNVQTCESVSLVKIDGQLLATNARGRSAFGTDADGRPLIDWIDAGRDWPAARNAVGGLSRLVSGGAVDVQWQRDGADAGFAQNRHPRTAAGFDAEGGVVLATVDGRTAAGAGLSLDELAQWFVWLGAAEAVNLDGGGSTTLWVQDAPYDGVVNYPSDDGEADHDGQRRVQSILAVFAPPLQRPTQFLTPPPAGRVRAGESLGFEVVAADPDGERVVLSAETTGRGPLAIDERGDGTARVTYTAVDDDPAEVTLTLIARVAGAEDGRQSGVLAVEGGVEPPSPDAATPVDARPSTDARPATDAHADAAGAPVDAATHDAREPPPGPDARDTDAASPADLGESADAHAGDRTWPGDAPDPGPDVTGRVDAGGPAPTDDAFVESPPTARAGGAKHTGGGCAVGPPVPIPGAPGALALTCLVLGARRHRPRRDSSPVM